MFEIECGKLVEGMIYSLNDIRTSVTTLHRDTTLYKSICNQLILPCILIYKLVIDVPLRLYFESLDKFNKNNFINYNFEIITKQLKFYNKLIEN